MRIAAAFACALLLSAPAHAQPDWEHFIDGVMAAQQQARHFAGAVVVVVSDGRIAFEKGYGFADFAERTPVDPARTLFRIASNSKMFVWTAVMQLVEQGRLDLHTDVNRYLRGVQVPATFPQPITLEHLMTHTAGFEDHVIGLFSTSVDGVRPLAEAVRADMPRRVFAPGTVPAYSNYGTALASLIVEQVSGVPYEKYVEDRILAPLGMEHATIRQPVPAGLAMDLSKGYTWAGGRLIAQPFEYVRWPPVGAMSVSGEDMGRFMLAHLGDGGLGEARILRPETVSAMRHRLASFSPHTNGMLHGFIETGRNGHAAYGHGGATIWFHSATTIFPAQKVGVFVAYNTDSGQAVVPQFVNAFVEHYFPSPLPKEPAIAADARADLPRFTGTYATSRASESDITTLIKLVTASMQPDASGVLVMQYQGAVTRWRQVEPLVFAQVDGTRRLVFRENDRGKIVDACAADPDCVITLRKQPWFMAPMAQFGAIGACVVIFIVALIGIPVAGVSQRRLAKPRGAAWARALAWMTSALFVAGLLATVGGMSDVNGTLLFGTVSPALRLGLTLLVIGAVLTLGLAVVTILAWTRGWWGIAGRACITIVCIAALGATAWLQYWKVLGWNY